MSTRLARASRRPARRPARPAARRLPVTARATPPPSPSPAPRPLRQVAGIGIPCQSDGTPTRAHAVVVRTGPEHRPTEPCCHRVEFRVVFALDYGLRDSGPVGPAFPRPQDAAAFCRVLNGELDGTPGEPDPPSTGSAAEEQCAASHPPPPGRPDGAAGVSLVPDAAAAPAAPSRAPTGRHAADDARRVAGDADGTLDAPPSTEAVAPEQLALFAVTPNAVTLSALPAPGVPPHERAQP